MNYPDLADRPGLSAAPPDIAKAFNNLGEWITRFEFGGHWYGGSYTALGDSRFTLFAEALRSRSIAPTRILECGCLEGGHTVQLAKQYPGAEIYAVDIREENLAKARLVAQLSGCSNIVFECDDFDQPARIFNRTYDAIFCVGLLYHLRWPGAFIKAAAKVAPVLWVWTVFCSESDASVREGEFRGKMYDEPVAHPLSAIREQSFFPTLGSLTAMLWEAGFGKIELVRQEMTANGSGPAILLCATRQ